MNREQGIDKFKARVEQVVAIPPAEWDIVLPQLGFKLFEKGQFLIEAGGPVEAFFFILEGVVRFYYLTADGKEINKAFAAEKDFVGSLDAISQRSPCRFSVTALEGTKALVLPVQMLAEGYERCPAWNKFGRLQAEKIAVRKIMRESEFLLDSAETRYLRFLQEYPGLTRRIPQYHIASYLGITEVALSRIRGRLKKKDVSPPPDRRPPPQAAE